MLLTKCGPGMFKTKIRPDFNIGIKIVIFVDPTRLIKKITTKSISLIVSLNLIYYF